MKVKEHITYGMIKEHCSVDGRTLTVVLIGGDAERERGLSSTLDGDSERDLL